MFAYFCGVKTELQFFRFSMAFYLSKPQNVTIKFSDLLIGSNKKLLMLAIKWQLWYGKDLTKIN
jgi:hypothetical protein